MLTDLKLPPCAYIIGNSMQRRSLPMKIVVLDGYTENPGDLSWSKLETLGELVVYDRTSLTDEAEVISRLAGAEIAITNKTRKDLPRLYRIFTMATLLDSLLAPI